MSLRRSKALTKGSTKDIVAFRPGRKGGYRIEAEGNVVHAYGFGSLVYVYSYAALKVRELVDTMLSGVGQKLDYKIEHGPSNSSVEGTCIREAFIFRLLFISNTGYSRPT